VLNTMSTINASTDPYRVPMLPGTASNSAAMLNSVAIIADPTSATKGLDTPKASTARRAPPISASFANAATANSTMAAPIQNGRWALNVSPSAPASQGATAAPPNRRKLYPADIAGQGIADPTAAIMSVAMLLAHVGEDAAAASVDRAVEIHLATSGGAELSTTEIGDRIASHL
jgi:Isocitrate/isopropylmalate dehydrogenase